MLTRKCKALKRFILKTLGIKPITVYTILPTNTSLTLTYRLSIT